MLREYNKFLVRAHRLLDIGLTAAAFVAAYFIKRLLPAPFGGLAIDPDYYYILLFIIIIWYPTLSLCGLYESYRKKELGLILLEMVKAVSIGMGILVLCLYIFKITDISRLLLGIFFFLNILMLGVSKGFIYKLLGYYRSKEFNYRNVLVIGSRARAKDTIAAIMMHAHSGFRILGCLESDPSCIGQTVRDKVKVIGLLKDLRNILPTTVVDEIIIAMPLGKLDGAENVITIAEKFGVPVRIIPDWQIHKHLYSPLIAKISYDDFFGYPTMIMSTTSPSKEKLFIKYTLDYILAAIAFIILLPFFVFIAITIKLFSEGPVFYQQVRSGLNGRQFMLYKFRTMRIDADETRKLLEDRNEADGPVFKIRNDPRIIPYIGTILRKTSLDELPQLINVLKGEMSLVGPRPPVPSEVEQYDDWQRRRLSMKPGLTCIWQTMPHRNDISFNDWMKLDLHYIDNWSLGLDFRLLMKTIIVIFNWYGR